MNPYTIEGILVHSTQSQADAHTEENERSTHTDDDECENEKFKLFLWHFPDLFLHYLVWELDSCLFLEL